MFRDGCGSILELRPSLIDRDIRRNFSLFNEGTI